MASMMMGMGPSWTKTGLNELQHCVSQLRDELRVVDEDVQWLSRACHETITHRRPNLFGVMTSTDHNATPQLEDLLNLIWQKILALGEICAMLEQSTNEVEWLRGELKRLRDDVESKIKKPILV